MSARPSPGAARPGPGATWVVGDIHGCAEALARLLVRLRLRPEDRLVALGDLYHRGPDPYGVYQQLAALPRLALVLGNHERALLRRAGLAGRRADGSDAPLIPRDPERLAAVDRRGDGGAPLAAVSEEQFAAMLLILSGRPYFLDGDGWLATHGSIVPGMPVAETPPDVLVRLHRVRREPGQPFWHQVHRGPELILYGHVPAPAPSRSYFGGRLVALGLDTGCVYGGHLTAYCPESGAFAAVAAQA